MLMSLVTTEANLQKPTIIIVGLGNPGKKYAKSRHNVGWMVVDELSRELKCSSWHSKWHGYVSECNCGEVGVFLLKPATYMNASGKSVVAVCRQLKISPEQLWVIHDDLDLPFGRLRIRLDGGSGGHKGVESIITNLGSQKFWRIRVGIGRPLDQDVISYVLSPFDTVEQTFVPIMIRNIAKILQESLSQGLENSACKYNGLRSIAHEAL